MKVITETTSHLFITPLKIPKFYGRLILSISLLQIIFLIIYSITQYKSTLTDTGSPTDILSLVARLLTGIGAINDLTSDSNDIIEILVVFIFHLILMTGMYFLYSKIKIDKKIQEKFQVIWNVLKVIYFHVLSLPVFNLAVMLILKSRGSGSLLDYFEIIFSALILLTIKYIVFVEK